MKALRQISIHSWAIALAVTLMTGPALAKNDKVKKDKEELQQSQRHFEDRHHAELRDYYNEHHQTGRCPPGLAKKNNGCMPPGLAKKWQVGQVLPRHVIYHEVPAPLVARLGPAPDGTRYVRVDSDLLLIQRATGLILDALRN